jgi:hypothetical protein
MHETMALKEKSLPPHLSDGATGRLFLKLACFFYGVIPDGGKRLFLFNVNASGEGLDFSFFGQLIQGIAHLAGFKSGSFFQPFYGDSAAAFADHLEDIVEHGRPCRRGFSCCCRRR